MVTAANYTILPHIYAMFLLEVMQVIVHRIAVPMTQFETFFQYQWWNKVKNKKYQGQKYPYEKKSTWGLRIEVAFRNSPYLDNELFWG